MISIWQGTFQDALDLSSATIKKYRLLLLLLLVITVVLNKVVESPFAAPQASLDNLRQIYTQMVLITWSLVQGLLLFLFTTTTPVRSALMLHQSEPAWDKDTWIGLASEPLRALMYIILGTIAFIIPGLIFYALYSFVMYIVLFSKEYQAGNQDALALSKELVKPMFFPFAGLSILVFALAGGMSLLPQFLPKYNFITVRALCELIALLISVYGYSLMRILFHKSMIRRLS